MQGYDSVQLKSDVELGGTDQKFNLLVGRDLQRAYGQAPQVVMTVPLLLGTDGVHKMSKALGNHIGINDKPEEMFGKVMSISDVMMWEYFTLLTDADVTAMQQLHPMEAKKRLAGVIATQYHGVEAAKKAQEYFERTVQKGENPSFAQIAKDDIPINTLGGGNDQRLSTIISQAFGESKSEVRRKIEQGGVKVDGHVIKEANHKLDVGREYLVQLGKRDFRRVTVVANNREKA